MKPENNITKQAAMDKEKPVLDKGAISEAEWQKWQISYGDRRAKLFSRILEALGIRRTRLS